MENKPESFERPLECSSCKRDICTQYTRVKNFKAQDVYMCDQCPVLENYLKTPSESPFKEEASNLICGDCNTSHQDLLKGEPMGCSTCYDVFSEFIIESLKEKQQISEALENHQLLHVGHHPGEMQELSPSLQLFALKEALNETLTREDYEQAAWLRDQIEEIKQKQDKR